MEMGWTHCPKKRQYVDNKNNGLATKDWERENRWTEKKMAR